MPVRAPILVILLLLCAGDRAAAADSHAWELGRLIASGGKQGAGATACFSCHGLRGEGDAAAAVPRLNGLAAYYLAKQMRDFSSGTRPDEIMTPIAKVLSAAEIAGVATYYAAMPWSPPANALPAPRVYAQGDPDRGILPCRICHGAHAVSAAPAIPSLAGQPAAYTQRQLRRWRSGERGNDPLKEMTRFSQRLTQDEIAAIAAWLALPSGGRGEG